MTNANIELIDRKAGQSEHLSERSYTRRHLYAAFRVGMGQAVDLKVSKRSASGYSATRDPKGYEVTWSVRRRIESFGHVRFAWGKGYRATFPTEFEAAAFAEQKWPVLFAWLEKQA